MFIFVHMSSAEVENYDTEDKITGGIRPMKSESLILFEYEDVLMGKRRNFDVSFSGTLEERRKAAGVIWRYAIEKLLRWNPEQALIYLNQDLIKKLKLNLTYPKIDYKYSTSKFFDLRFILQYAFPERIKYDLEEDARSEYERVAKLGAWENDKESYKFHKNYFSGTDGIKRAAVVLMYAISLDMGNLSDLDIYELYHFFANKRKATLWLTKMEIESNVKSLYATPLEYLHYSLPKEVSNTIFFINEYFRENYMN